MAVVGFLVGFLLGLLALTEAEAAALLWFVLCLCRRQEGAAGASADDADDDCRLLSVSILNYEGNIIFRVGSVFVAKLAQSSHGAKYQHHALPKIRRCHKAKLLSMLQVSKNREGSVEEGEGALPFGPGGYKSGIRASKLALWSSIIMIPCIFPILCDYLPCFCDKGM